MKASDIKQIISDLITNVESPDRAILIDGCWGCGKTYEVQKIVKKYEGKNKRSRSLPQVYYASLFGVENIIDVSIKVNDLLTSILKRRVKKILKISAAVFRSTKIVGGIAEGLDLLLDKNDTSIQEPSNKKTKKLKRNTTIIFDDVERVGENFPYISFLGFINSLVMAGLKVVCVCCSNLIVENHANEFNEFKEKTFDRIYEINESLDNVFYNIFESTRIENENNKTTIERSDVDLLKNIFDGNLRIAQKTAKLFSEAIYILNRNQVDYSRRVSTSSLLCSCLCAVKIIYEWQKETPSQDNTSESKEPNSNAAFITTITTSNFSNETTEKLYSFFGNNSSKIALYDSDTVDLTICLIYLSLYKNDQFLINYLDIDNEQEKNSVENMRYMSEKDNIEFTKKYIEDINNDSITFTTPESISELMNVFRSSVAEIDTSSITEIANKIADEMPDMSPVRKSLMDAQAYVSEATSPIKELYDKLWSLFPSYSSDNKYEMLRDLYSKENYYDLNQQLIKYVLNPDILLSSKEELLRKIKDLNYFLPDDLAGEFNKYRWDCCMTVSEGLENFPPLFEEYTQYLNSIKENSNNDPLIHKRVDDLINHRIL